MEKIIYDKTLKDHLGFIKRASEVLITEDEGKTVEQFKAQIDLTKELLRIAGDIVTYQSK